MKINFQNLGPIKNGSIELGKLTVIAGSNNTGKTYITYTIFSLFHFLRHSLRLTDISKKISNDLRKNHKSKVSYTSEMLKEAFIETVNGFDESDFSRIFSSEPERFADTKISLSLGEDDCIPDDDKTYSATIKVRGIEISILIKADKKRRKWDIECLTSDAGNSPENEIPISAYRNIEKALAAFFLPQFFPKPFLSTSERLGIALFYKDLDSNRNALVEHLQQMAVSSGQANNTFDPFEFLEKATSRFAFPIHENINYIRKLESIQKETSELTNIDLTNYISSMMGGNYKFINDEIIFSNNKRGQNKISFPIHLGSSSLRSLADVFFYLKHSASKNDLLMIDEPESHLTPQNQILFVRMISAAISEGLNIYITTHSDYIIKEINNVIMLSNVQESDFPNLKKKYNYHPDEALQINDVNGYVCTNGTIIECKKSSFGLEVSNIDDAIEELNNRSLELSELTHKSN